MRKLLAILLLIPSMCFADISIELTQRSGQSDEIFGTGKWNHLQISYGDNFYVFGSTEEWEVNYFGGNAFNYLANGIGFGLKKELTDGVKMFGQVGYYFIDNSWGRRREHNEPLHAFANTTWSEIDGHPQLVFQTYEVENDDAPGVTFGLEMTHPITKSTSVGFVMSYRYLMINETIAAEWDAWDYENTGTRLESVINRNYSSINVGINLEF